MLGFDMLGHGIGKSSLHVVTWLIAYNELKKIEMYFLT